ncbi:MAG: hypothetical protein IKT58_03020 [Oscillospiraceae bacterium]|nr:hypothetical protein [Oscillospiraceae bacterium]
MKCLRCRRELSSDGVFCPECDRTTSVPLENSPYLSKKVVIPKRIPAQKVKKSEAKKQRKTLSIPRLLYCVLSSLACIALILQLVYVTMDQKRAWKEADRLRSMEDECVLLTDKLRQAEAKIRELEALSPPEVAP